MATRSQMRNWIGTCAAIVLGVMIGLGMLGTFLLLWMTETW